MPGCNGVSSAFISWYQYSTVHDLLYVQSCSGCSNAKIVVLLIKMVNNYCVLGIEGDLSLASCVNTS